MREVTMTKILENLANQQKEYLSVSEMAAEFGIHEMTFYRMIRDKKIPAFKIGSNSTALSHNPRFSEPTML